MKQITIGIILIGIIALGFYWGTFWGFLFLIIIAGLIAAYYSEEDRKKRRSQVNQAFHSIPGWNPTTTLFNENGGVGLDESIQKIVVCDQKAIAKAFDFKDFLGCEIEEDGNSIYKKQFSNIAGRAVVGGLLLGGLGAIVGGSTARTIERKSISKLILKLYFASASVPYSLVMFDSRKSGKDKITEKDSIFWREYTSMKDRTMLWVKKLNNIPQLQV